MNRIFFLVVYLLDSFSSMFIAPEQKGRSESCSSYICNSYILDVNSVLKMKELESQGHLIANLSAIKSAILHTITWAKCTPRATVQSGRKAFALLYWGCSHLCIRSIPCSAGCLGELILRILWSWNSKCSDKHARSQQGKCVVCKNTVPAPTENRIATWKEMGNSEWLLNWTESTSTKISPFFSANHLAKAKVLQYVWYWIKKEEKWP